MTSNSDIVRIGTLYPKQRTVAVVGSGIIPAGTPVNKNGEVTTGADAIGILRYDVDTGIGQRGVIVIEGVIDAKWAQEHSGVTYTSELAGALPSLAFTNTSSSLPDTSEDIATDAEVTEALDELFDGHK